MTETRPLTNQEILSVMIRRDELAAEVGSLTEKVSKLQSAALAYREALKQCVTQEGAHCLAYGTDTPALRARLRAINETVNQALS